ncbi:uncharacterized protein PAC_13028 [Phialocephala subalpina]|uniref:Uncharacterized protein n=1 Tax=Phialocephala subalpina TaxID=576137 RepID=A0A1L7XDN3_9HELO|nr:uncharacterized protein PAC_13028 [Phialocephala subalpina]
MASPSSFKWGTHNPTTSASPHIRLRCMVLDVLASSPLPRWPAPRPSSSANSDAPETPFAPITISGITDTNGPFFMPGGTRKYCWDMSVSGHLPHLLSKFEFDPKLIAAISKAEAHAEEEYHPFVTTFDGKKDFGSVVTSVSIK